MIRYIINKNPQPTGEHEVHREDICGHLPDNENRIYVGDFENCWSAINEAKRLWPNSIIDGCAYCSEVCHGK